jgi:hypothetical protein
MNWGLVTTVPNTEKRVGEKLTRMKVPHHMFKHQEQVILHHRKVLRTIYTFPRYVFVHLTDCWRLSDLIDDIIGPVRFGEEAASITPGVVERLAASCVAGNDVLPYSSKPLFVRGARVLLSNPNFLTGETGVYLRSASDGRALVEFSFLGQTSIVNVQETSIRPISEVSIQKAKRNRYKRKSQRRSESQLTAPGVALAS